MLLNNYLYKMDKRDFRPLYNRIIPVPKHDNVECYYNAEFNQTFIHLNSKVH